MLNSCCLSKITMSKIALAFILLTMCAIPGHKCYRIVEWKPLDIEGSGSDHGEEDTTTDSARRGDDAAPKSRTSIVIWNGIESKTTKQPKTYIEGDVSGSIIVKDKDSDSSSSPFGTLQQLNPGLKISMWNPTTEPESNESKQQLKVNKPFLNFFKFFIFDTFVQSFYYIYRELELLYASVFCLV